MGILGFSGFRFGAFFFTLNLNPNHALRDPGVEGFMDIQSGGCRRLGVGRFQQVDGLGGLFRWRGFGVEVCSDVGGLGCSRFRMLC